MWPAPRGERWGAVGFHLRAREAAVLPRAGAGREGDPAVRDSGCCGGEAGALLRDVQGGEAALWVWV